MRGTGEGHGRPPVMEDVAKVAGVSHQTVSRVLNNNPNVSPGTRERVELAIAELGYRRNIAARSLVTRQSQTIGVLAAEMSQYGPANTLLAVEQAARDAGYFVSIAGLGEVTKASIDQAVSHFLDQSVDGIVVLVPHPVTSEALRELHLAVPVVMVGAIGGGGVSCAAVDQRLGARLAVQHLIDLGHTKIGHLSGPEAWIDGAERIRGWRETLAEAGLDDSLLLSGDWSAEYAYRVGLELARQREASAVFAANDQMALGLLRAFHESGVRVPDDVSIVGFDDQPDSGFFIPPLTTVRQGFDELGRRCIEVLLAELAGGERGATAIVSPRLVVRQTTAAPSGV
ncbi:MAG TPA: LacI family DNA-binding transcriptional regulator [Micrococcaceae bacterium]|nr:LacI family DNA-binding transcriptional regulator [Micrococcaceae bacterium]